MEPTVDEKTDFIWHSNRIDFNTIDSWVLDRQTVLHSVVGAGDLVEINSHARALHHVIVEVQKKVVKPILLIKDIHTTLMAGIEPKIAGKYRKCPVYVGDRAMLSWELIPKYLKRLGKMMAGAKTEADAWAVHDEFECIHPFMDGNGRTGRLLLSYVRLRLGLPLKIIRYGRDGDQFKYYKKIQEYRENRFKQEERL